MTASVTIFGDFWGFLKNVKNAAAFWATFGKHWVTFYLRSSHSLQQKKVYNIRPRIPFLSVATSQSGFSCAPESRQFPTTPTSTRTLPPTTPTTCKTSTWTRAVRVVPNVTFTIDVVKIVLMLHNNTPPVLNDINCSLEMFLVVPNPTLTQNSASQPRSKNMNLFSVRPVVVKFSKRLIAADDVVVVFVHNCVGFGLK